MHTMLAFTFSHIWRTSSYDVVLGGLDIWNWRSEINNYSKWVCLYILYKYMEAVILFSVCACACVRAGMHFCNSGICIQSEND